MAYRKRRSKTSVSAFKPECSVTPGPQYSDYPELRLPDGRVEITVGDLVSEEERYLVLLTDVLPLPLLPDGTLPASLEGEELIGLEFLWTQLEPGDAGDDLTLVRKSVSQVVRIQATQDAADVVKNNELVAVIANQRAGKAVREATDHLAKGLLGAAQGTLNTARLLLDNIGDQAATAEGSALLSEMATRLDTGDLDARTLKSMIYEARYYSRTSSDAMYTGKRGKSKFNRKKSAEEQGKGAS
jgi:hypothetical protein